MVLALLAGGADTGQSIFTCCDSGLFRNLARCSDELALYTLTWLMTGTTLAYRCEAHRVAAKTSMLDIYW